MKLLNTVALVLTMAGALPAAAQSPTATAAAKPAATPPPASQRLDGIAAVVNNEVVLQSDVEEQLYLFLTRAQTEVDSATVDTLRSQILNQLIDEKLIVAEAQRLGLTIADAEINRQAQEALKETRGRFDTPAAFQQQLRKENMTEEKLLDKFRDEARRQGLVSRMMSKQATRHQPTQAEAESYFKTHRDKFPKAPAEVRLSVIQIPAAPDSAAESRRRRAPNRSASASSRARNSPRWRPRSRTTRPPAARAATSATWCAAAWIPPSSAWCSRAS